MSRMAIPGSSLPGGYVLGAMSHADRIGLVYEARSHDGREAVSAQVLHPLHVDELRGWFETNAQQGQALQHPHLVRVLAVGETHNGLPVKVTERVEGRTLRARIAAGDLLVGADLARVVRAVAEALDYLHGQSPPVYHLGLMPENVVCTTGGAVKLVAVGHAECPRNAPTKPSYRSPEDLCGAPISPASDVFSLASLTYELITGRPAFAGSVEAIVDLVQRGPLPLIGVVHSSALAPLNRVFHRAWTVLARDRTPRAGVFASELEDALRLVPAALLSVRRGLRETGSRSAPPSGIPRASQPPAAMASRRPTPAFGRPSSRPVATVAARLLTPYPAPMSAHRGASAIYALPPPPRLPAGLSAPTPEPVGLPAGLSAPTPEPVGLPAPRSALASAPPPAHEAPRTRVDTDDAVLILEPVLVDAADLPEFDDALPPLEPVRAADDDGPELEFVDESDRLPVVRQSVTVAGVAPVRRPTPTPKELVAVVPPAQPAVRESRPSWSHWRPEVVTRSAPRPWHAREMRFTPKVVAAIVVANMLFTAAIVAAVVLLLRR